MGRVCGLTYEEKREQSCIYRVLSDLFIVSIFVNIVDDEMRYKHD